MTSFNFNYLLKDVYPTIVTLGVRASAYEFWGDTIQSIAVHSIWFRFFLSFFSLTVI